MQDEKEYEIQNLNVNDKAQGRSASHGLERNFKSSQVSSQQSDTQEQNQIYKCDIKFNKKSVNYDMSEIELPAFCKSHPDGKLLYIITPDGRESELGCVY